MLTDSRIFQDLQTIFNQYFNRPPTLRPEMSAKDVPGWDSLAQIILIIEIEKHFQIRFALGEVENTRNIGELAELIQNHLIKGQELG